MEKAEQFVFAMRVYKLRNRFQTRPLLNKKNEGENKNSSGNRVTLDFLVNRTFHHLVPKIKAVLHFVNRPKFNISH